MPLPRLCCRDSQKSPQMVGWKQGLTIFGVLFGIIRALVIIFRVFGLLFYESHKASYLEQLKNLKAYHCFSKSQHPVKEHPSAQKTQQMWNASMILAERIMIICSSLHSSQPVLAYFYHYHYWSVIEILRKYILKRNFAAQG